MNIEVLSGVPNADLNADQLAQMQRNGNAPAVYGQVRHTQQSMGVMLEKIDFSYAAGTANGQQSILTRTAQAGYKRLKAVMLITKARNASDDYEVGLQLTGQTVINRIDFRALESNAVTPVMGRWVMLDREIEQSTIELLVDLQGTVGNQLSGDLRGQLILLLTKV